MKKISTCIFFAVVSILPMARMSIAQSISAYQLWKTPSFFRGFNITYSFPITQQDILDLKNDGATLAYISTEGFWFYASPYNEIQDNIDQLDQRIAYCDSAKIHYAIAVRQGPGRSDVYLEGAKLEPSSTIWKDTVQQRLYGSMLREITARYASDSFFVAITPTTEPDPFYDSLCCFDTALFYTLSKRNNFDLTAITQLWVDSIRVVSPDIPILIQGPSYSTPTVFSLVPIINDPHVIYEFHNYHPPGYAKAADTSQVSYPGVFLDAINGIFEDAEYNRSFIEDTLFHWVSIVEQKTRAPIFMGEFGLEYPHTGGPQFLSDEASIAIEKGWHFAYWDWRRPPGLGGWDYEDWTSDYMSAIVASLQQPNSGVTNAIAESNSLRIILTPNGEDVDVEWTSKEMPVAIVHITLYDMIGRELRSFDANGSRIEISTSGLPSGCYYLMLKSGTERASAFFDSSH